MGTIANKVAHDAGQPDQNTVVNDDHPGNVSGSEES